MTEPYERPTFEQFAELLALSARLAYGNTLVGYPAPIVADCRLRMKDLRPGDLVLEITTLRRPDWTANLGYYVRTEHRTNPEGIDPTATYPVVVIRSLHTGDEVTWENCDFIAIPTPDTYCSFQEGPNRALVRERTRADIAAGRL